MRKSDVETYYTGHERLPSVNVKVHNMWDWRKVVDDVQRGEVGDERFTADWIEEHISDEELDQYFWHACEYETEYVQDYATELLGSRVKVWTEGRSGGHLVVEGLDDIESWDAIALGRWAKFAKFAREVADGIPYQVISLIGINAFDAWATEQDELAAEDAAAELPVVAGV